MGLSISSPWLVCWYATCMCGLLFACLRLLLPALRWRLFCSHYQLDSFLGFLPSSLSLSLPPSLSAYDQLARDLPQLNRSGDLGREIASLRLDGRQAAVLVEALPLPQLRRAYVLLGCIAHSLANANKAAWERVGPARTTPPASCGEAAAGPVRLPSAIAMPWSTACRRLGLPEVLTSTGLDLWNHSTCGRRSGGKRLSARDFAPLVSMSGTKAEVGFHAVPFGVQLALAPLLREMLAVPSLVRRRGWPGGWSRLVALCERLTGALTDVVDLLGEIEQMVEPDIFYDVYRPLLGGWDEVGLELEGVPPNEEQPPEKAADVAASPSTSPSLSTAVAASRGLWRVVHHKGPSAGQTAILMLVDAVLGVHHGPLGCSFRREMRDKYLPRQHAKLLASIEAELEKWGSLHEAAADVHAPVALVSAHNAAVDALIAMRKRHMRVASNYLRKTSTGTGGSDFRTLLGENVAATRRTRIGGGNGRHHEE